VITTYAILVLLAAIVISDVWGHRDLVRKVERVTTYRNQELERMVRHFSALYYEAMKELDGFRMKAGLEPRGPQEPP
jgi:hypothetical protein